MKLLSLILFLLVFILLLFKEVSIRITYSDEFRIELDYYPFLLVFKNFGRKKKKRKIRFRLLIKRVISILNSSRLSVSSLPPKISTESVSIAHGIAYSLIYPTLAYASAGTKELSIDKRQTRDTLDITLDIRLYLIIKELFLFVFDVAKENISGKHA